MRALRRPGPPPPMGIRGVCRGAKPEIVPLRRGGRGDGWQPPTWAVFRPNRKAQTNSQFSAVILIVHCLPLVDAAMQHEDDDPQPVRLNRCHTGIAMTNHCAYCHGKFGLVRYRRAFKTFCSQTCVNHYRAWLRAEVGKRKSWSDCLWLASLNVVPYAGEKSSV